MCLCLLSGVSVAMFKHHTGAITSVEWHPTDSSVFVASGSDDQVTLWDLAVERDSEADGKGRQLDVPPQLLFIHMVSDDEWSVNYWGLFSPCKQNNNWSSCMSIIHLITSILKSLVILTIWLALINALYSRIAPLYALNRIFSPAYEDTLIKYNNQSLVWLFVWLTEFCDSKCMQWSGNWTSCRAIELFCRFTIP